MCIKNIKTQLILLSCDIKHFPRYIDNAEIILMLENNVVNRFPSLIYCNGLVIFPRRLSFSFFSFIRFVFALKQSILKFSVTYLVREWDLKIFEINGL